MFVETIDIRSSLYRVNTITGEERDNCMRNRNIYDAAVKLNLAIFTLFHVKLRRNIMMYKGVSLSEIDRLVQGFGGRSVYNDDDIENITILMPGVVKAQDLLIGPVPLSPKDETIHTHSSALIISTDLEKALRLPFCDINRTYSNNFHVMAKVFDIEMARNYHYHNSIEMIEALDASTNTHWIDSFSDVVTQSGTFKGVGASGISKIDFGFLTRSTISEPNKILPAAAIFDRKGESAKNSSTAIGLALPPRSGTGMSDYGVDLGEPINYDDLDLEAFAISLKGEDIEKTYITPIYDSMSSQDEIDPSAMAKQGQIGVGNVNKMRRDDDRSPIKYDEEVESLDSTMVTLKMVSLLTPPIYGKGLPDSLRDLMNVYRRNPTDILFEGSGPFTPNDILPKLNINMVKPGLIDMLLLRNRMLRFIK
jgi:hypothetical protein